MMMQPVDSNQINELYGTAIPLVILLIENDEDREFLSEAYVQYKALMCQTANHFFKGNQAEVDDAVGASVERLCKYCKSFYAVPCNKRPSYIVKLVENVCRTRLRTIIQQKDQCAFSMDDDVYEQFPAQDDVQEIVFSRIRAGELLRVFMLLPPHDQELIRMRHVDLLGYTAMAQKLNMSEGAVRTALVRAKQRWERLAKQSWEGDLHD